MIIIKNMMHLILFSYWLIVLSAIGNLCQYANGE
jgi:hypothetical protein